MAKGNKPNITVGLKGDPESFKKAPAPAPVRKPEVDQKLRPAVVVSRLDHNATISYNGEALIIPPRGRIPVGDKAKLGAMPKGVTAIAE